MVGMLGAWGREGVVWTSKTRPRSVSFIMWPLRATEGPPGLRSDKISAMFERNHYDKIIYKKKRLDTGKAIQRISCYHPEIMNALSLNAYNGGKS